MRQRAEQVAEHPALERVDIQTDMRRRDLHAEQLEVKRCEPQRTTLHRPPRGLAATANLTGALSRDTPVPGAQLAGQGPLRDDAADVGRKRVIFAVIDSLDDVAP